MISLRFACSFEVWPWGERGNEVVWKLADRFGNFLAFSRITHLDLRNIDRAIFRAFHYGRGLHLPLGLQWLALPALKIRPKTAKEINSLVKLTSLECGHSYFWPSLGLIGLKRLSVAGGATSGYLLPWRDGFFASTLERLTNLSALEMRLLKGIPNLGFPGALQELRVTGIEGAESVLASALASLPELKSLVLEKSPFQVDARVETQMDLGSLSFHGLRKLALHDINRMPLGITAPVLTDLSVHGQAKLGRAVLATELVSWISTMTSVRQLELCGFMKWGDMAPLASLPLLAHLIFDQPLYCLNDMMRQGGLQSLETMLLRAHVVHDLRDLPIFVLPANEHCMAAVAKAVLELPRLRLLSCVGLPGSSWARVLEVEGIAAFGGSNWKCLYSRGQDRRYERVRC